MKTLLKVPSMLVLASSACFAGTTEVVTTAPVAPASEPWFSASAFAGYESMYFFRGLWFSNNNLSGGVNFAAPINDKLTFAAGALYTESLHTNVNANPSSLDYSEMDIFASLSYATDFATFVLSATHYQFFDTFSGSTAAGSYGAGDTGVTDATDFGISMVKSFGNFNYTLSAFYDVRIDAPYFETGLDYTYAVNDKLSLVPVVQLGYAGTNYYTANVGGNGLTHVRTAITAPYKVTDAFTVTPMIAANTSLEARDAQNRVDESEFEIYGGISVSYSF